MVKAPPWICQRWKRNRWSIRKRRLRFQWSKPKVLNSRTQALSLRARLAFNCISITRKHRLWISKLKNLQMKMPKILNHKWTFWKAKMEIEFLKVMNKVIPCLKQMNYKSLLSQSSRSSHRRSREISLRNRIPLRSVHDHKLSIRICTLIANSRRQLVFRALPTKMKEDANHQITLVTLAPTTSVRPPICRINWVSILIQKQRHSS